MTEYEGNDVPPRKSGPGYLTVGYPVVGAALFLLVFLALLTGCGGKSQRFSVGDEILLRAGNGVSVVLGHTKDDFGKIVEVSTSKDDGVGLFRALADGRGFMVPSGTKATLISRSWTVVHVRLNDGRTGWTAREFAKPSR